MKRVVTLLTVVAITVSIFVSCDTLTSNKYAGTYTGTMSSGLDTNKVVKDNIKILITNGVTDATALYMDGLMLNKTSETEYYLTGSQLSTIIQLIAPTVTSDKIENANCELVFSENKLDLAITYKLLEIIEVKAISYTGTKSAK
jgi:hypothetical protein